MDQHAEGRTWIDVSHNPVQKVLEVTKQNLFRNAETIQIPPDALIPEISMPVMSESRTL